MSNIKNILTPVQCAQGVYYISIIYLSNIKTILTPVQCAQGVYYISIIYLSNIKNILTPVQCAQGVSDFNQRFSQTIFWLRGAGNFEIGARVHY